MISNCKEHAESRCVSYPNCYGCNAYANTTNKEEKTNMRWDEIDYISTKNHSYDPRKEFEKIFAVEKKDTNTKTAYEKCYSKKPIEIKKVIFNDPATIVYWSDDTKTVVKAVNETFDPEKGLAMAVTKKFFGNKGSYFNEIKKWVEPYYLEENPNATVDIDS